MLNDVQVDGLRIELEDGTQWRINPLHSKVVSRWLPTSMIRIQLGSDDATFPSELLNVPAGALARAVEMA